MPGDHAYASVGSSATSSSATATTPAVRSAGRPCRRRLPSDAQAPPLAPNRLAEVTELVLNQTIDAVARLSDRLADLTLDALRRDLVEKLFAMLARPSRAGRTGCHRTTSGQLRAPEHRGDRSASRRSAAKEQGGGSADRRADERGGEQVVLRVTPSLAVGGGLADAWPPLRAGRDRCTHRLSPPASDSTRQPARRPRPRCEARRLRCARRAPSTPSR